MTLYWIGLVIGLIVGSVASLVFCLVSLGKKMKQKELEIVKAEKEQRKKDEDNLSYLS